MDEFMVMVLGFVIGCVTVLVIWGITALIRGRIRAGKNAKQEEIIASIEGKWSDVESLVSSYRSGRITAIKFKDSLSEKLETINHTYKPHIHRLDIFFVKYTESLIKEFSRMLPAGRAEEAAAEPPAFDPEATIAHEPFSAREIPAIEDRPGETVMQAAVEAEVFPAAEQEPAAPEPQAEVQEEPVIAAMAEAAKGEDELPLETFLEMGTGTGTIEETAGLDGQTEERRETPVDAEQAPAAESAAEEAVYEQPQEAAAREESIALPLPPESEIQMPQTSMEYPEETMEERPFSFAGSAEPEQSVAVPPPPPAQQQPYAPVPPPPQRRPAYTRDESVQPATIYDVEAETIIADRSEILKTPVAAAEHEQGKSSLGITGDDVSDMLDQFFGGPKK